MYIPRHESEDQGFVIGFVVGLLLFWSSLFIMFLESFVMFTLASKVKFWPWAFLRTFAERLFSSCDLTPLSSRGFWSTSNVSRLGLDVVQAKWAILSELFALQLPLTHLGGWLRLGKYKSNPVKKLGTTKIYYTHWILLFWYAGGKGKTWYLPTSLLELVISTRHKEPASLGSQSEPMCNSSPTYTLKF